MLGWTLAWATWHKHSCSLSKGVQESHQKLCWIYEGGDKDDKLECYLQFNMSTDFQSLSLARTTYKVSRLSRISLSNFVCYMLQKIKYIPFLSRNMMQQCHSATTSRVQDTIKSISSTNYYHFTHKEKLTRILRKFKGSYLVTTWQEFIKNVSLLIS